MRRKLPASWPRLSLLAVTKHFALSHHPDWFTHLNLVMLTHTHTRRVPVLCVLAFRDPLFWLTCHLAACPLNYETPTSFHTLSNPSSVTHSKIRRYIPIITSRYSDDVAASGVSRVRVPVRIFFSSSNGPERLWGQPGLKIGTAVLFHG